MASVAGRPSFFNPVQRDVLEALEPFVTARTQAHLDRRKLWFPNELMSAGADAAVPVDTELQQLRDAARGLPDQVRVALAINLLTEEGLPHFHRLIAVHLGNESPWSTWNNLWTAEEDRHGCVMRDYVRDARIFDMDALERMQYRYIESGFNPAWERDPYRLLAYTSLQERATQERALYALLKVMPALAMPGHTIPNYDLMSEVVRRGDIYGPRHYQKIVEELLAFWHIGERTGLAARGRELQDKLMKIPARLARMVNYVAGKSTPREFAFDFLGDRPIKL